MKQILYYSLFLAVGFLFNIQTLNAQERNDKQGSEKNNSKFSGDKFKDETYKISASSKHRFEAADPGLLKKLNMQGKIVNVVVGRFLLEYWGTCFIFQPNIEDCSDCILLWHDYNNDQFVQARKELRAVCQSTFRACGINVRKKSTCN